MLTWNKKTTILGLCAVALITFVSLRPTLNNQFTNWDDNRYVTLNPEIRSLSWNNIKHIFTSFHRADSSTSEQPEGLYKPLTIFSYAVEYHFVKLKPWLYHATNLAFHLGNTLLVFWLISLLGGTPAVALITALLFGIHPLHVESVAWVSERKDMFYTFFMFLSAILYLLFQRRPRKRLYLGALICFALSLMSKPMGITLPGMLLLFDYLRKRKYSRQVWLDKIPFVALSLVFLWLFFVGKKMATGTAATGINFPENFFFAGHSIVFYIQKFLWPVDLSSLYHFPQQENGVWPLGQIFSVPILVMAGLAILYSLRHTRKIAFGALFFLFSLAPVLNLIPGGGYNPSDRYTYVAVTGLAYLFAELAVWVYAHYAAFKFLRSLIFSMAALLTLTLGILSHERSKVWYNGLTLWDNVIRQGTTGHIPYNSRGLGYYEQGYYLKAIEDFNQAIFHSNNTIDRVRAITNRGNAYGSMGLYDEAIADYKQVLSLIPDHKEAQFNLGVALRRKARAPKVRRGLQGALKNTGGLPALTPLEQPGLPLKR